MKIVNLKQSGPHWHRWRSAGIGGSDACAILGTNKWQSRDELLANKILGKSRQVENAAMSRGKDLEAEARRVYEEITGRPMTPVCMEHDRFSWLRASLDGWNAEDGIILEIKCMGVWNHKKLIQSREVPYYYRPQCHHEMLVCDKAKAVHFWGYTDSPEFPPHLRYVLIEVPRNEDYLNELFIQEAAAMEEILKCQKEVGSANSDTDDVPAAD